VSTKREKSPRPIEDELFDELPSRVKDIWKQAKSMRREKQRSEFRRRQLRREKGLSDE